MGIGEREGLTVGAVGRGGRRPQGVVAGENRVRGAQHGVWLERGEIAATGALAGSGIASRGGCKHRSHERTE